jgi:hypothetical protein
MKKGDKIFLSIVLVIIGLHVFNGIVYQFYKSDTVVYFGGMMFWIGIPWIIYRIISHFKTKKVKNALQST